MKTSKPKKVKYPVMYFKVQNEKGKTVQRIKLFYTRKGTVRVMTNTKKISEHPSSRFKTTNKAGVRYFIDDNNKRWTLILYTPTIIK